MKGTQAAMNEENLVDQGKRPQWVADMKRYERPKVARAVWQLANTVVPYVGLWAGMIMMIRAGLPYALTLGVALIAAFFLIRLFIFFHDACHGSFFPSQTANRLMGRIIGVLSFTAFDEFRHSHGVHHATAGDLDRRGVGDVWTMTVAEYEAASPAARLSYRLYRHPLVMFFLGPIYTFLFLNRIPARGSGSRRFLSVILTDLGIAAVAVGLSLAFGWRTYLMIQLPVILMAGTIGIWLFYVQHQFDPSYWARHEEWGSVDAALLGSSHYRLPAILQWATASIGLHHIHHLRPRIPNYNLSVCHREVTEVQLDNPLTVARSFGSLRMNLWDEARGTLVSFRQFRRQVAEA
jgi:omega-6 fatty acid desaturase (delta-12 desaturase)